MITILEQLNALVPYFITLGFQLLCITSEKIETEIARCVPDRTSRVMRYQLTDMPANFEVEDFMQSW